MAPISTTLTTTSFICVESANEERTKIKDRGDDPHGESVEDAPPPRDEGHSPNKYTPRAWLLIRTRVTQSDTPWSNDSLSSR
jgi:hypothetical protein